MFAGGAEVGAVLWAIGDDHIRAEVHAAYEAAVAALAGWIEAHAHTRYRVGGEVVVVDTEGIVAAGFRQHKAPPSTTPSPSSTASPMAATSTYP